MYSESGTIEKEDYEIWLDEIRAIGLNKREEFVAIKPVST